MDYFQGAFNAFKFFKGINTVTICVIVPLGFLHGIFSLVSFPLLYSLPLLDRITSPQISIISSKEVKQIKYLNISENAGCETVIFILYSP